MTRFLTAIAAALLTVSPVTAAAPRPDICPTVETLARTIMEGRQVGVPMTKMMEVADNQGDNPMGRLIRALIVAAFEKPRYMTAEIQQREVDDFANEAALECYRATGRIV